MYINGSFTRGFYLSQICRTRVSNFARHAPTFKALPSSNVKIIALPGNISPSSGHYKVRMSTRTSVIYSFTFNSSKQ